MFPTQPKTIDTSVGFQTSGKSSSSRKSSWHKESNSYINQDVKQQEREKVLDFILSVHGVQRISLLSMPGERWIFETMLNTIKPKTIFTAIESDLPTFLASRSYLVTDKKWGDKKVRHGTIEIGSASLNYSNTIKKSKLLHIKASDFCTLLIDGYGASKNNLKDWKFSFCNNTAAWFDFTCQLCQESEKAIKYSGLTLSAKRNVPIVYTVMNARDSYSGVDSRVSRICELAGRDFELRDHWTYSGMNGVPMLTVCGIMRRVE